MLESVTTPLYALTALYDGLLHRKRLVLNSMSSLPPESLDWRKSKGLKKESRMISNESKLRLNRVRRLAKRKQKGKSNKRHHRCSNKAGRLAQFERNTKRASVFTDSLYDNKMRQPSVKGHLEMSEHDFAMSESVAHDDDQREVSKSKSTPVALSMNEDTLRSTTRAYCLEGRKGRLKSQFNRPLRQRINQLQLSRRLVSSCIEPSHRSQSSMPVWRRSISLAPYENSSVQEATREYADYICHMMRQRDASCNNQPSCADSLYMLPPGENYQDLNLLCKNQCICEGGSSTCTKHVTSLKTENRFLPNVGNSFPQKSTKCSTPCAPFLMMPPSLHQTPSCCHTTSTRVALKPDESFLKGSKKCSHDAETKYNRSMGTAYWPNSTRVLLPHDAAKARSFMKETSECCRSLRDESAASLCPSLAADNHTCHLIRQTGLPYAMTCACQLAEPSMQFAHKCRTGTVDVDGTVSASEQCWLPLSRNAGMEGIFESFGTNCHDSTVEEKLLYGGTQRESLIAAQNVPPIVSRIPTSGLSTISSITDVDHDIVTSSLSESCDFDVSKATVPLKNNLKPFSDRALQIAATERVANCNVLDESQEIDFLDNDVSLDSPKQKPSKLKSTVPSKETLPGTFSSQTLTGVNNISQLSSTFASDPAKLRRRDRDVFRAKEKVSRTSSSKPAWHLTLRNFSESPRMDKKKKVERTYEQHNAAESSPSVKVLTPQKSDGEHSNQQRLRTPSKAYFTRSNQTTSCREAKNLLTSAETATPGQVALVSVPSIPRSTRFKAKNTLISAAKKKDLKNNTVKQPFRQDYSKNGFDSPGVPLKYDKDDSIKSEIEVFPKSSLSASKKGEMTMILPSKSSALFPIPKSEMKRVDEELSASLVEESFLSTPRDHRLRDRVEDINRTKSSSAIQPLKLINQLLQQDYKGRNLECEEDKLDDAQRSIVLPSTKKIDNKNPVKGLIQGKELGLSPKAVPLKVPTLKKSMKNDDDRRMGHFPSRYCLVPKSQISSSSKTAISNCVEAKMGNKLSEGRPECSNHIVKANQCQSGTKHVAFSWLPQVFKQLVPLPTVRKKFTPKLEYILLRELSDCVIEKKELKPNRVVINP